jgi:hypothetical protein
MYAYSLPPIDAWPGWLTVNEFKQNLVLAYGGATDSIPRFERFLNDALELGKDVGWEGDFRDEPMVAGLPPAYGNPDGSFMVGWKQDNNGETFIVSPFPLPWLERDDNWTKK